jgi:hypothetical protein
MTEHMLPFLTAGLVVAESDTEGRACYTPVDTDAIPEAVEVNVEAEQVFDDHYLRAFADERATLETCEPRDSHEITIPKPATGWGWECHYPQEEVSNEEI